MDPLSLLAAAKTAAATARAAIQVGRDIAVVVKEYNALHSAQADLAKMAADPPRGWGQKQSPEQIAMQAFAAKKEAEAMEIEIRNYIVSEWGLGAWDQIQKEIASIRKQQKEAAIRAAKQRAEERFVTLVVTAAAGATILILVLILAALRM